MAAPKYAAGDHVAFWRVGEDPMVTDQGEVLSVPGGGTNAPYYLVKILDGELLVDELEIVGTVPSDLTPAAIEEWLAS